MESLKIFRSRYVDELKNDVLEGLATENYIKDKFSFDVSEIRQTGKIVVAPPKLKLPEGKNRFDFDNSKLIFEAYKNLTPTEATDTRLWTFLSHVTYWEYMRNVRPVENISDEKRIDYIITHWFVRSVSATNLLRQEISLLWWVAYLTYDDKRSNRYELTHEAFSMLDYTRHLFTYGIGWNKIFVRSLLEFVIDNDSLFSSYKQERVRFLMRKCNYVAGYKILTGLSAQDIKNILNSNKKSAELITG